jgi:hypothetical protein
VHSAWRTEERFQTGKDQVGLDAHQVRRWRSCYRWATLSILAHAFLVVAALAERTRHPTLSGLIPLSCNEVQHPFAALLAQPAGDLGHRLRWSVWRRRHQARACACHYRRQAARHGHDLRPDERSPRQSPMAGSMLNTAWLSLPTGRRRHSPPWVVD